MCSQKAFFILCLLASAFVTSAQEKPVARVWATRFDSEGHVDDAASAIAVDASGNVFVAGESRVPSFQTGTNDFLMIKYSGSGQALWTNHFPTVQPVALATDTNGNVFMTGSSYGENPGADFATMAFSGAGVPLWTNLYSSPGFAGSDRPNAMALDTNGNVYVVGISEGFIPAVHTVIKYANSGLALWTNYFSGGNLASLNSALCVDVNGDVIATGSSIGTNGYTHYQTVKFASSGTPLWTNWYYGPGNFADVIAGIASDASGNVYVTGTSWANTTDTQEDIATVAYSAAGLALWTNRFDGERHDWDQASRIGVNANGTIVVTGTAVVASGAPPYIVVIGYSAAGTELWTKFYNNWNAETHVAVDFDEFGNTLLAGTTIGITGGADFFALKISNEGEGISTNRFSGTNNDADSATSIAAGNNGDFFVAGYVRDNDNGVVSLNFATLKYSIVDPIPLQAALNGGKAVLSWSNPTFQLQSTPSLDEPFTDVPGAVSGYSTDVAADRRFYRLVAP